MLPLFPKSCSRTRQNLCLQDWRINLINATTSMDLDMESHCNPTLKMYFFTEGKITLVYSTKQLKQLTVPTRLVSIVILANMCFWRLGFFFHIVTGVCSAAWHMFAPLTVENAFIFTLLLPLVAWSMEIYSLTQPFSSSDLTETSSYFCQLSVGSVFFFMLKRKSHL